MCLVAPPTPPEHETLSMRPPSVEVGFPKDVSWQGLRAPVIHDAFELIPVAEADNPYIVSQAELFDGSNDACGDHTNLIDKDGAGALKASIDTVSQHPRMRSHSTFAAIAGSHVCERYFGDAHTTGTQGLLDHP